MRFDPGTKPVDVHRSSLRRTLEHATSDVTTLTIRGTGFIITGEVDVPSTVGG